MKKLFFVLCLAFILPIVLTIISCQNANAPETAKPNASGSDVAKTNIGVTWTQRNLPAKATWSAVTFGNGKFAAVSQWDDVSTKGSQTGAVSSDGITWTSNKLPEAQWVSLAFGSSGFVAIAWGGGDENTSAAIALSSDGSTWKSGILPSSGANLNYWNDIAYNGKEYYAVVFSQPSNGRIAYSSGDCRVWTVEDKKGESFNSIVGCDPGKKEIMIFGNTTTFYCCDYTGVIPLSSKPPVNPSTHRVAYGDGTVVAIKDNKAACASLIEAYDSAKAYMKAGLAQTPYVIQTLSSIDLSWKTVTLPFSASCITYGDGTFVVLGSNKAATSTDGGLTWTTRALPVSANWSAATFGNGTVVAVAYDAGGKKTSTIVTSP